MNPNDASISVNETDLNWGDTVTFTYSPTEADHKGHRIGIMVDAFQDKDNDGNIEYVYGARGLAPGDFVLSSLYWTDGAAHCVATLFDIDFRTGRQKDLATTEFDVAA
jgi:hypothetical protein